MEKEKLKQLLENGAREVNVKGETAELKSPEQREAEQEFQSWKKDKKKYTIIQQFKIPNELLKCLLATKRYEGLIFTGEGGIGKTILTISSIKNCRMPRRLEYPTRKRAKSTDGAPPQP